MEAGKSGVEMRLDKLYLDLLADNDNNNKAGTDDSKEARAGSLLRCEVRANVLISERVIPEITLWMTLSVVRRARFELGRQVDAGGGGGDDDDANNR